MKIFKLLFLVTFFFILTCCSKKEEMVFLNGDIVGYIQLIDTVTYIQIYDNSGIKVSLEQTEYSATTNTIGKFELIDIPAGTYNIVFEKENYKTEKITSFQFIGGNVPVILERLGLAGEQK